MTSPDGTVAGLLSILFEIVLQVNNPAEVVTLAKELSILFEIVSSGFTCFPRTTLAPFFQFYLRLFFRWPGVIQAMIYPLGTFNSI